MSPAKPEPPAESVRVNIFGQTYSLRSPQGGERVLRVAGEVDERMREIASHLAVHDAAKVAVLAALNLADELELVREHYEREIESLLTAGPEPAGEAGGQAPAPAAGSLRAEVASDSSPAGGRWGDAEAPAGGADASDHADAPAGGAVTTRGGDAGEIFEAGPAAPGPAGGGRGTAAAGREVSRREEALLGDETPPADEAALEEAALPVGEARGDETRLAGEARRSWFDEIFETDSPPSESSRPLSSHVASRLKRLRHATRAGTIRDSGPTDKG